MMGVLRLLHRWAGGFIGLFLAVLGLSGTLLVHKSDYLRLTTPHAADAQVQDTASLARAAERIFGAEDRPRSIVFAGENLGLNTLNYGKHQGGYATQEGEVVDRWTSKWARPELWLFDLHHYLLIGDPGKTVAGILSIAGLIFIITGVILWWPTRRLFTLRVWPTSMKRNAVVWHHRDLGLLTAPVLFVSLLTGLMMTLPAVEDVLLAPFTRPSVMAAAQKAPKAEFGPLADDIDYRALLETTRARYPDGEIRILSLPSKPGMPISVRVRQQAEWLPNGRTMFWFDPATGKLVGHRDAQAQPLGVRIANAEYPIHAAKVGGLVMRLVMSVSGLALTLLGSLAVWTFWVNPKIQKRKRPARKAVA